MPVYGMLRDLGWLWALFFVVVTILIFAVSPVYLVTYPILIGVCVYFSYMRYDKNGQRRTDI